MRSETGQQTCLAASGRSTPCISRLPSFDALPVFDASYPSHERFPRRVVVAFAEQWLPSGRTTARLTLVRAEPNAFPCVPIVTRKGKTAGFTVSTHTRNMRTDHLS